MEFLFYVDVNEELGYIVCVMPKSEWEQYHGFSNEGLNRDEMDIVYPIFEELDISTCELMENVYEYLGDLTVDELTQALTRRPPLIYSKEFTEYMKQDDILF